LVLIVVGLGFQTQGSKGFNNKYPIDADIFNLQGWEKSHPRCHENHRDHRFSAIHEGAVHT